MRAALAAMFEFVAVIPESELAGPTGSPDLSRLALVPAAREEVIVDLAGRKPYTDVGALRRVPVRLGARPDKSAECGVPE